MNLLILTILLQSLFISSISAYPRGGDWNEKLAQIKERAASPIRGPDDSSELIGDLVTVGATTPVGKNISAIITGNLDGQDLSNDNYIAAPLGSSACAADTCCVWKYVVADMVSKFTGDSGRCNLLARGAVRLGFHDAGAWKKGMTNGGADGSMILTDEISRDVNRGLEEIVAATREWYGKYQPYGAGAADIIQMGANVATVVCPLGPRTRSFVGRKDGAILPPDGLLPDVKADAESLISLFEDKTIKPHGLVTLVGAHTTSQQRFFEPAKAFDPQDSTPGVWDVLFYTQTLNKTTPPRVVKFPSDVLFSTHPRCSDQWDGFTDPKLGQQRWNDDYAKEYVRLSLLGVDNINSLTECTKVLPPFIGSFTPPDKQQVNQWLQGGYSNFGQTVGQLLNGGRQITNASLALVGVNPMAWNDRAPPAPNSPYNKPPPSPAPVKIPIPKPQPRSSGAPKFVAVQLTRGLLPSAVASAVPSVGLEVPGVLSVGLNNATPSPVRSPVANPGPGGAQGSQGGSRPTKAVPGGEVPSISSQINAPGSTEVGAPQESQGRGINQPELSRTVPIAPGSSQTGASLPSIGGGGRGQARPSSIIASSAEDGANAPIASTTAPIAGKPETGSPRGPLQPATSLANADGTNNPTSAAGPGLGSEAPSAVPSKSAASVPSQAKGGRGGGKGSRASQSALQPQSPNTLAAQAPENTKVPEQTNAAQQPAAGAIESSHAIPAAPTADAAEGNASRAPKGQKSQAAEIPQSQAAASRAGQNTAPIRQPTTAAAADEEAPPTRAPPQAQNTAAAAELHPESAKSQQAAVPERPSPSRGGGAQSAKTQAAAADRNGNAESAEQPATAAARPASSKAAQAPKAEQPANPAQPERQQKTQAAATKQPVEPKAQRTQAAAAAPEAKEPAAASQAQPKTQRTQAAAAADSPAKQPVAEAQPKAQKTQQAVADAPAKTQQAAAAAAEEKPAKTQAAAPAKSASAEKPAGGSAGKGAKSSEE